MSHTFTLGSEAKKSRYDHFTITLHWLTALLVLTLFTTAHIWEFLAKGTPWRSGLQFVHISLGILLAAVIILRILWRLATHNRVAPAVSGFQHVLATAVHLTLYALLISQVSLGFLLRWSSGTGPSFFGLFTVPPLIIVDPATRHLVGELHNLTAWAIIAVAGLHAAAALAHHYVLRDRVLVRMLPTKA